VTAKRTYENDGCAAAHALDLIGERWALLVVRELMLGPKRFTDLQNDLPHISPNVLSQRLRDLEGIGALHKYKLPPPAASQVYELTPWGYELEPILQQLGRWGAQSPSMPRGAPVTMSTLVMGMRTMFQPDAAAGLNLTYELRLGAERFRVHVENARLEVTRGATTQPDAILTSDVGTLKRLIFEGLTLEDALDSGKLEVSGDLARVAELLELFKMPPIKG
jgi:DNA-binding HxlR family transcriptional regulator/putative sterol carrier protein